MEWERDNQPRQRMCLTKNKRARFRLQEQKSSVPSVSTPLLQRCCPLGCFQCFQSIFSLLTPTIGQPPDPVWTVAFPQGERSPQAVPQAGFAWSFITCLTWMGARCSTVPQARNWCDAHHCLGTCWKKAARQHILFATTGCREDLHMFCRALL